MQGFLDSNHSYSISNTSGSSGQGAPPETNLNSYDDTSVTPEDWEERLQSCLDLSDVDAAFTSTHPVLEKFSANNG